MKKLLIVLFVILFTGIAYAATDVSFRWTANTEPDLAGYKLYRGTASGGPYSHIMDIPKSNIECTDAGVADGTYFWVLTAFDEAGFESGYSNEVTTSLDSSAPAPPKNLNIWQKIIAWLESGSEKMYGWLKGFAINNG